MQVCSHAHEARGCRLPFDLQSQISSSLDLSQGGGQISPPVLSFTILNDKSRFKSNSGKKKLSKKKKKKSVQMMNVKEDC